MKKFTTILAAASLMLAGLASCNEPGPQPEPPVPEATWDEKVADWKSGTDFTGDLPLPVEQLQDLIVDVAEAEGKIKVTIDNLEETVPETEEGEDLPEGTQPRDYYTVFADVLSFAYYEYVYDDEDGDQDEGYVDVLTKFDADGDFANLHVEFSSPWTFLGVEIPGYVELTWDVEKALTPAAALAKINSFIADDAGVAGSNLLKEGETLDNVGSFFRVNEVTTNVLEDAILDVADVFDEDAYIDDEDDFFVELYWNYADKTTEAETCVDVANELIDELNYETTMEAPVASIDQKGNTFTYFTLKEGAYNRVDLRIVATTIPYTATRDVIAVTIYAMPKEAGFDGEVVEGLTVKTFSKPEGPGVVPAEDALLNVLDVESEGQWTYESRYSAIGNLIETKAANAQGDTVNGNFFEQYDQLRLMLSLEVASQPNTAAIAPINNYLANWLGEGQGFTNLIPDLQTTLTEGGTLNVKVTTYTDHEGQKTFLLDYYDYYPTASYDGENTVTYAERWKQLIEAQTYTPEGSEEPVKAWATPEQRTTSTGVTYWATRGNEKVTVGTGMDAKDKCVHIQWVPQTAFLRVIIYVDDAPAAWNVAGMNKLIADGGFTTVVPHLEGELFFNLDQYLQYGQFVCYAPDAESELLEAFAEQFVCLPEDEDEDPEALPARDPEPEPEPEWIDESFDYSGMWVYQFYSIEVVPIDAGIPAECGGNQISVQAYNQGGISYFLVQIEETTSGVAAIENYINGSLNDLGWTPAVDFTNIGYIDYLVSRGYANYSIFANYPYDPVGQTNFVFALDITLAAASLVNYVLNYDVAAYAYYSQDCLYKLQDSTDEETGIRTIIYGFYDNGYEIMEGTALKYGQFTVMVNGASMRLIWNVGKNQNQALNLADANRTFEALGMDLAFAPATAFGEIFAHDYIDDYWLCNVRSSRIVDDFDVLKALIDAGFEIFNIEGVDVDLSGWNQETYTGTIVIIVWDDPEDPDRESIFELTINVTVANTEIVATGETDPVSGEELTEEVPSEWKVVVSGWWVHIPAEA